MRSWLFRRRVTDTSGDSSSYAIAELAPRLGGVLDVEQVKTEGHALGFGGRLLVSPPSALTELVARFRPLGYTPFLQEGAAGMTWVRALPFVDVQVPSKPRLNILLFVLTVVSTIVAGSGAFFTFDPLAEPRRILDGVPFAFTLLAILGTHEFGHYFVARAYGASVSLPYFIPAPPPFLFGTLGAIIRTRSQLALRHRGGRPHRGTRRCPPRALDRARLVEGGRAARGGQRGLRRLAPHALHDVAGLRAASPESRRVRASGRPRLVGRSLRHRAQLDPRGPARRRAHRVRPLRIASPPGFHRHVRGPPRPRRPHRVGQLVRVGISALLRHGIPAPAAPRRSLAAVSRSLRDRRALSHPPHPPHSARSRRDTVTSAPVRYCLGPGSPLRFVSLAPHLRS